MKIKKILLVAFISFISLFAFVSCSENLVLNDLLRAANNIEVVSDSYLSEESQEINNIAELNYSSLGSTIITLDDGESDLSIFIDLRFEIISLHQQILDLRLEIKDDYLAIKDNVSTFKEGNYVLLEDDKEIVISHIQNLKEYRSGLLDTKGQAYQRLYDLRGSYTRDNLPEINQVFTEVIEVLEYRLETLQAAVIDLNAIDQLLLEYLES